MNYIYFRQKEIKVQALLEKSDCKYCIKDLSLQKCVTCCSIRDRRWEGKNKENKCLTSDTPEKNNPSLSNLFL